MKHSLVSFSAAANEFSPRQPQTLELCLKVKVLRREFREKAREKRDLIATRHKFKISRKYFTSPPSELIKKSRKTGRKSINNSFGMQIRYKSSTPRNRWRTQTGSTEKGGRGDIQMEIENENGKATEFATSLL